MTDPKEIIKLLSTQLSSCSDETEKLCQTKFLFCQEEGLKQILHNQFAMMQVMQRYLMNELEDIEAIAAAINLDKQKINSYKLIEILKEQEDDYNKHFPPI